MNRILVVLTLCFIAAPAFSQTPPSWVDPACVGVIQPPNVDATDSNVHLCVPWVDGDGDLLPSSEAAVCEVRWFDGSVSIATGAAGQMLAITTVPKNGVAAAEVVCRYPNLTFAGGGSEGEVGTVTVTHPEFLRPAAPILLD